MPMVTIQWLEGRTSEQKAKLAEAITKAMVDITHVSIDHVWIAFDDVKRSDWSMKGKLLSEK